MAKKSARFLLHIFLTCLLVSLVVFLLTSPQKPRQLERRTTREFNNVLPWEDEQEEHYPVRGASRNLQGRLEGSDIFMGTKSTAVHLPHKRRFKYSVVQESRHIALSSVCRETNQTWRGLSEQQRKAVAQRILVDDDHQLLYCSVPLAASGPWMKVMYFIGPGRELSDISKVPGKELSNRKKFLYLSSLSLEEQEKRFNSYLKFMVTRHPFLRIAIAYKFKFEADNPFFHERYGKEIVRKYRSGAGEDSTGKDVRFSEFAQYLADSENLEDLNEHWQPLDLLCRPCEMKYDFILHHETVQEDSSQVLDQAELSDRVPTFPYDTWDYIPAQYAYDLFKQLTPAVVGRLVEKYGNDFALFSYSSLFTN